MHKRMPKRFLWILPIIILLLGAGGCGSPKETGEEENKEIVLTGEMVPMASYQAVKQDLNSLSGYVWQGSSILYLESTWDKEREISMTTLYRVNADGTGVPEALYTGISENHSILCFALGQDGSFYLLEREKEGDASAALYLRKLDKDFREIYLQALDSEEFRPLSQTYHSFSGMYVDYSGNVLMTDYDNKVYLFNAEGEYVGTDIDDAGGYQCTFLDAGEEGVFLVRQDYSTSVTNYLFREVDFKTGKLGNIESRDLSFAVKDGLSNMVVLSDYCLGILVSTESSLYSYRYDTGEYAELLSWKSLNVDGSSLQSIRLLQENFPPENLGGYTVPLTEPQADPAESRTGVGDIPEAAPVLEALSCAAFLSDGQNPEIVRIGHLDRGCVPDKQTITLGTAYIPNIKLGKLVRSFNRSNKEYEIVIKNYNDFVAFTDDLILHPSEIPDMLEISFVNKDMLESKGLLENLEPYFRESDVVGKDDILETVWEACESNGKVTSMITGFSINSLASSADTVPRDGWTYDQLFELGTRYPDAKLLNVYTPLSVWNLISTTMDSYIDWEQGKCNFDTPEFMQLLVSIKNLKYPENQEEQRVFYSDEEDRKFLEKEYLLQYNYFYSPYDYNREYSQNGNQSWDVGFPTASGEPCFIMDPSMQLAVYSNSVNKEGAWAFLEFVLSEEEQSWYGTEFSGFPVRKNAFDVYLTKPYHPFVRMEGEAVSEETSERIRHMMDHIYPEQSMAGGELYKIINEEIQAFFAGDKTVEECVEIIQNRAQLYMDENL